LALARENVKVQKDALARSEKIFEWSNRRAKLQLGDTSDLLQAQAALEIRRLQLDSATHEAISAARTFNTARGIESSQVNEVLDNIDVNRLLSATLPVQPGMRDDVKAALQQQSAAIASSKLGVQKNTPTLDLFGTYALNSRQGTTGQAMGKSWSLNYPSSVIGVRFSSSLDISGAGNTKDGYRLEETAADLNYTKKLLDEKQEWNELRDRFDQGKSQLKLTQMIEATQEKKLKRERDRLSSGRSTTYQVLVFEQDFAAAQLARIQSEASLFQIYSKVRLYQGSPQ
jgi:outer membrane protein TolC